MKQARRTRRTRPKRHGKHTRKNPFSDKRTPSTPQTHNPSKPYYFIYPHGPKAKTVSTPPTQTGGNQQQRHEQHEQMRAYYCDYMKMKSDATSVAHRIPSIRTACEEITRTFMHTLDYRSTILCETIRHIIVHPYIHTERGTPQNPYPIFHQFMNRLVLSTPNAEQKAHIKEAVLRICMDPHQPFDSFPEQDRKTFMHAFVRVYLKGGTAMSMAVENIQQRLRQLHETHPDQVGRLHEDFTMEEITSVLGKASDYDFNFTINPYLPEHFFNLLVSRVSIFFFGFFDYTLNHHPFFRDMEFLSQYQRGLLENEEFPLYINPEQHPRNNVFVKVSVANKLEAFNQVEPDKELHNNTNYAEAFRQIPIELTQPHTFASIQNPGGPEHPRNNMFSEISSTILSFADDLEEQQEGIRPNDFLLIRMMINHFLDMTQIPIEIECDRRTNVSAEMIDISVPQYTSKERFSKWVESETIFQMNGIYLYNMYSIIHDLDEVIKENEKLGRLTKLPKRKRRVNFFYNLVCVLPQLLHADADGRIEDTSHIQNACTSILKEICPNVPITSAENRKRLSMLLSGVYINYPETIKEGQLNIYKLVKHFMYQHLQQTYRPVIQPGHLELTEIHTTLTKQRQAPLADLEYDVDQKMKDFYFTVPQIRDVQDVHGHNHSILTHIVNMEPHIMNYMIAIVDDIEQRANQYHQEFVVSGRKRLNIHAVVNHMICRLMVEFNHILVSVNDNTLRIYAIECFFKGLVDIRDMFTKYFTTIPRDDDTSWKYMIGHELLLLREKYTTDLQEKLKYNNTFVKKHHYGMLSIFLLSQQFMLRGIGIPQERFKHTIRGGYIYDIYRAIQQYQKTGVAVFMPSQDLKTNDVDVGIYLNMEPEHIDRVVKSIYDFHVLAFKHYFGRQTPNDQRSVEGTHQRTSLMIQKISETQASDNKEAPGVYESQYLLQLRVYDIVPYEHAMSRVFTESAPMAGIPSLLYRDHAQGGYYRVLESHCYDMYIYNKHVVEPNERNAVYANYPAQLVDFAQPIHVLNAIQATYMNAHQSLETKDVFSGFFNDMNANIMETVRRMNSRCIATFFDCVDEPGETEGPYPILDIKNLYIHDMLDVIDNYNQIVETDTHIVYKQKYLNRMLSVTSFSTEYRATCNAPQIEGGAGIVSIDSAPAPSIGGPVVPPGLQAVAPVAVPRSVAPQAVAPPQAMPQAIALEEEDDEEEGEEEDSDDEEDEEILAR